MVQAAVNTRLKPELRRSAAVIRGAMVIAFLCFTAWPGVFALGVLTNDTEFVSKMMDVEVQPGFGLWQKVFILGLLACWVSAVAAIYLQVNWLLGRLGEQDFFGDATVTTLRGIGRTMIFFWITIFVSDCIGDWLVTFHHAPADRETVELWIDQDAIYGIVGYLLTILARVLEEAKRIEDDNRQII